jgi:hypothetical protein
MPSAEEVTASQSRAAPTAVQVVPEFVDTCALSPEATATKLLPLAEEATEAQLNAGLVEAAHARPL